MNRNTRLLVIVALLGIVLVSLTGAGLYLVLQSEPTLDTPARTLFVRLKTGLQDAPAPGAFIFDEHDFPPLLTETTQVILEAAEDDQVEELALVIEPTELGWAGVQELADAITAFVEAGKPCHAYGETLGNKEYLLAAACGDIHLAPAGLFLVNGLSVTQVYYAETLDRIGVEAEFEHVGDFKSAVEPMERTGPSEPARMAQEALLDSLYEEFVSRLAYGRGWEPEQVRRRIDDVHLDPRHTLEAGWVDALTLRDDFFEDFVGEDPLRFQEALDEVRRRNLATPAVAVVHLHGTIVPGEGGSDFSGSRYAGDRQLRRILSDLEEDDDVTAVVLRVDSPGGSGLASDNIWQAVRSLRQYKPVVVSMGDMAASGGYYVAAGADAIYAEPSTLTGSIGVFGGKMDISGLLGELGLSLHRTKRGEHADLLAPTRAFSESGRKRFRAFLEGFYDLFLSRAAEGRGMSVDEVHAVAQGRVWTGSQALEHGLVDELGGLHDAVARARDLAGAPEATGILRLPRRRTFVEQLLEDLEGEEEPPLVSQIPSSISSISNAGLTDPLAPLGTLVALQRALDPGGVAAMVPGHLEVH